MKKGIVYLIGAGPGDPGLLTIKAKKLLEQAEVIVYDRLVSQDIVAMANPEAEYIYAGKTSGHHALSQEQINIILVEKAAEGKTVARLKGGDPFLYGRGGEEALYIRNKGYEYEVIPGVTSAIAAPAYAGIPVTHREATSSLAIITGHEKPGKKASSINWEKISTGAGTLVFLMGVENLSYICEELIKNGRSADSPIALIRQATLPGQEVLTGTLANIVEQVKQRGFKPPAVIVVGDVVNLRERLNWLENKPLWGKKIVVTRSRAQASVLVEKIRDMGGQALEYPVIHIEKEENIAPLLNAFNNLGQYDWLIFTSVNGVEIFFEAMYGHGMDIRDLKGIKICAIGPATAGCLEARGIKVDTIPGEYIAEGMLAELRDKIQPGQWVLLPRARGARSILPDTIHSWGARVNEIHLYRAVSVNVPGREIFEELLKGEVSYVTFTSSSTVTNFVKTIGQENIYRLKNSFKTVCIGPVTAQKAGEYGLNVDIVAEKYTIEGLLEAILKDVLNTGVV